MQMPLNGFDEMSAQKRLNLGVRSYLREASRQPIEYHSTIFQYESFRTTLPSRNV